MKPWLIFDFDDTLGGVVLDGEVVPVYRAYNDTIDRFGKAMADLGFNPDEAVAQHKVIDETLCRILGFGDKARFARSMEEVYRLMVGSHVSTAEANRIFDIGMTVFTDYPYAPLEGVLDVLDHFAPHYRIAVVTKGEDEEQRKKLTVTGVERYSNATFVCDKKDDTDWYEVFTELGLGRSTALFSWAVGNSIHADVNPPLRAGVNAIHLHDPHGWTFEHAEYEQPYKGRKLEVISDIRECMRIIPIYQ
jgi:putative hydrolase of the HAD superfamily